MVVMLLGGSLGGMLSDLVAVIKPGRVVLVVLVRVVKVWGLGESHLLTGLKEQGIHNSHL